MRSYNNKKCITKRLFIQSCQPHHFISLEKINKDPFMKDMDFGSKLDNQLSHITVESAADGISIIIPIGISLLYLIFSLSN